MKCPTCDGNGTVNAHRLYVGPIFQTCPTCLGMKEIISPSELQEIKNQLEELKSKVQRLADDLCKTI